MIETVFEITLAMSVIILLIFIFSPVIEKRYSAKWRYFIWLFIAIRLVIPINITLPKPPINIETPVTNVYIGKNTRVNSDYMKNTIAENSNETIAESFDKIENNDSTQVQIPLMNIVEGVWVCGVVLFIGYNLLSYMIFRMRIIKGANEVDFSISKEVQEELKIKSSPKIVISSEILSPMLIGFVKPLVILPQNEYSDDELKVIFKHEFTHYKRHDLWYKFLLIVANGIHWFNPIVYCMVKQATRDLEYSCDDAVVKNKGIEYRKNYSMTILKSMENSRATALSTYLSKNGANEMKRFKNVLDMNVKKKGFIAFICVLLIVVLLGSIVAFNNAKLLSGDNAVEFFNMQDLKKYYIDFAMDYRIDFMPNFDENTYTSGEPVSSVDFLMLTYYMNRDKNLPEDLSLSTDLVERVMREHFGVNKVKHESQFKGWTYVPEENKYTPYPDGTAEDTLFDVVSLNTYNEGSKKIYDVVLKEYLLPFRIFGDLPLSEEEYKTYESYANNSEEYYDENVRFLLDEKGEELKNGKSVYKALYELIVDDNTNGFKIDNEIHIKYYIDEESGKPRFIYKQAD